jgi:hypothetical protein
MQSDVVGCSRMFGFVWRSCVHMNRSMANVSCTNTVSIDKSKCSVIDMFIFTFTPTLFSSSSEDTADVLDTRDATHCG